MAETHDPQTGETRAADARTGDPAAGAPRPSRTGSVPKLGFDDPSLRPLSPEQLEYHAPHPDPHPERHEHSDVPIRPLAYALITIAGMCVFTFALSYWLFWHYKGQQEAMEARRTAVPDAKPLIEGPRLQGVPGFSDKQPIEDLKDLREAYRAELESYGRTRDGFAQVPIDRAMQVALERGMFKTAQQNAGAQGPGQSKQATTGSPAAGTGGATTQPRSPRREEGVR